jgi:serpin B
MPLNKLAFKLFHATNNGKNHVISPLSIAIVLAILRDSGSIKIQSELISLVTQDVATVIHTIEQNAKDCVCVFGNSIWKNTETKNELTNFLAQHYKCDMMSPINKANITEWIKCKTNNIINDIDVKASDDVVVINTILFDSDWKDEFGDPYPGVFHSPSGDMKGMFLSKERWYEYSNIRSGWQCVHIPLMNNFTISLMIHDDHTKQPTHDDIEKVLYNSTEERVKLRFPLFTIESPTISLKEPLQKLGIIQMFESDKSNFLMLNTMKVDDINHKVIFDVSQKGVKAAGVTIAHLEGCAQPKPAIDLSFNKPFYFFVHFNKTIVFLGHLVEPTPTNKLNITKKWY